MISMFSELSPILSIVFCLCIFLALRNKKDIYLFLIATILLVNNYFLLSNYFVEFIVFSLIYIYWLYLMLTNYKINTKFHTNKNITYVIQLLSIILFSMIQIDMIFLIMLMFGYIMLFRQERWHKHLNIMFLMILIIFTTNGGLDLISKLLVDLK